MSILRRKSDLRSLCIVGFTFLLLIFFLKFNFFLFSWYQIFPLFFFLTFFIVACTLINHNHRHHLIFRKSYLNELFNGILSICIGSPSTRLHLVHHYNHHRHYPSLEDWSHFESNAKGRGLIRLLTYLFNATKEMSIHRNSLLSSNYHRKELRNERRLLFLFYPLALLWNWKAVLFFIIPAQLLGLILLLSSNLLNHDLCDLNDEFNHSRDFINSFENYFFCNNGHHTAHHKNPHLHWEELPDFHQKYITPKKRREFSSGSFFVYLIKYVFYLT